VSGPAIADSGSAVPAGGSAGVLAPRRLHPLTPVLEAWKILAVIAVLVGRDGLQQGGGAGALFRHRGALGAPGGAGGTVLISALLLVAAVAAAVGLSVPSWLVRRFWTDGRELHVRSGLVRRSERNLRLDRIQAVDVDQPLRARLFGLATVRVTMAAGTGASVRLSYLSLPDAQALRDRLLATSAGIDPATPSAPEQQLAAVRSSLVAATGALAAIPTVLIVVVLLVVGVSTGHPLALAVPALPVLLGGATAVWRRVNAMAGFTLARSADGYRVRSGLLDRRAQTVPPHRIQAVRIHRPLLWRPFGWARVEVDVAGLSGGPQGRGRDRGEGAALRSTDLLPIGSLAEAESIVGGVLGTDPAEIVLDPVPRRARWLDPIGARAYGCALVPQAAIGRAGVLNRRWTAVPYARIQSVRVRQGPLQRSLSLATVHVDSPRGPVHLVLEHRDAASARALVADLVERARAGRDVDLPDRWMTAAAAPPAQRP